ncbi:MAG: hypothetical protein U9Q90_00855 [Campylobacterota bacterium]|nr:hypothetical protein [Campylobacterota bacterium]
MFTLREELEKHIRKLIMPLKAEEDLIEVLRKRLTKKEYKLLKAMALETPEAETFITLNLDAESYDKMKKKLI